jgi:hypothetical protein
MPERTDLYKLYKRWYARDIVEEKLGIMRKKDDDRKASAGINIVGKQILNRGYDEDDDIEENAHTQEAGDEYGMMEERSIFRGVDRLKLIHSIITSNYEAGCKLDMNRLMKEGCLLAYFPLHDLIDLGELEESWLVLLQVIGRLLSFTIHI